MSFCRSSEMFFIAEAAVQKAKITGQNVKIICTRDIACPSGFIINGGPYTFQEIQQQEMFVRELFKIDAMNYKNGKM